MGEAQTPATLMARANVVEFGIRVTEVKGGYLINNFSGQAQVCITLEEAKQIVTDLFDETFKKDPAPETTTEAPAETPSAEVPTA